MIKLLEDCKLICPGGIMWDIHNTPKNWKISISENDNHFDIEHIDYMLSWRGSKEESVIIWNGNCFRTIKNVFPSIKEICFSE